MRDSPVYAHLWSTDEVRALFEDESRIQSWLDILVALAVAQAELGIIPEAAARELREKAKVDTLDLGLVISQTRSTAHSTLGLIRGVQAIVSEEAGEWLCYGATVQDVSDTWTVLTMRQIGVIVYRDLRAIEGSLLEIARDYRDVPVAGRTHGQPGVPVTFGFKVSVWASEVRRHIERLKAGRDRWLVGQLGGAAGTGSFWGAAAPDLLDRFCKELGLGVPDAPWDTARDRLAEFSLLLAMVTQTLGKIGNELLQLQRPEIGEASERFTMGEVGSITMPHKRNPERAEHLVTLARMVRASVPVLLESMIVEHERDARSWKAEWVAFPDVCQFTGASLTAARGLVDAIEPDAEAMRRNLDGQGGYLFSEQVMRALAERIGKQSAHTAVYEASMVGRDEHVDFREALAGSPEVVRSLSSEDLDALMSYEAATAGAVAFVDRVLATGEECRAAESTTWTS